MQLKGKICIVGVLDVVGSTNIYMAKAFRQFGYDVIPVNYRTILAKYGPRTLESVLFKLSSDDMSLMLFSKCNGIDSSIIAKCSLNSKTWLWWMDPMVTLTSLPEIMGHINAADYVSATGLGVANYMKKEIGAEVHHIMEGVDPEVYRPIVKSPDFAADISFIGTNTQERLQYLHTLANAGLNVKAYGDGFGREAHGNTFNMICSSSGAMLAVNTEHNTQEYFSDRVFRLGACGAFVFHSYSPKMEKYFADGEDIVYFDKPELLVEAVKYYFDPSKDELRLQMATSLRNKVLNNHTWVHTVQKIIEIAEI